MHEGERAATRPANDTQRGLGNSSRAAHLAERDGYFRDGYVGCIGVEDVIRVIAEISGVPIKTLSGDIDDTGYG